MTEYAVCVRCGKRFKADEAQKEQYNIKCDECKMKTASVLAHRSGKRSNLLK